MRKSTKSVLKWIVYFVVLLLLFVLQTMPGLFSILGTRPILIVPFAICISMFESEKNAAIIGAVTGALWDVSSAKLFGFSATIILICCVACSLLVMYLIKLSLPNAILLCGLTMLLYGLLDFCFTYVIWGYSNVSLVLTHRILPLVLYTTLISPLVYLGARRLFHLFDPIPNED